MKYLGQEPVDIPNSEFVDYTPSDWAELWILMYSQIDGSHHKAWCMDQILRILNGTKVIVTKASWADGTTEYRYRLDEPTDKYISAIEDYEEGGEYYWDEGIAP